MLFNGILPLALALASFSVAAPTTSSDAPYQTHLVEKISGPPAGWTKADDAKLDKESHMVKLRIQLAHQGMDKFHEMATKIATPGFDIYGGHMSQDDIDEMIGPKDESMELVLEWLATEGLDEHASASPRSDAIILTASVAQVERILDAEYSEFVEAETGERAVRTLQYSLPDMLRGHVDMVQPTTFFGLQAMRSTIADHHPVEVEALLEGAALDAAVVDGCTSGRTITPKCLSNLYGYATARAYSNGLMAIAGFLTEWPIVSDLRTFMGRFATQNNANQSFTCTLVNGGVCPQDQRTGIEANLDVQYARVITQNIPNVYYSVGGSPPWLGTGENTNEPYLEFLEYMLGLDDSALPQTISISYGDDEDTVPLAYANHVCNLFAQLGARGVSVLVASGDSGVGTTCQSGSTTTFTTSFPASCPWVTTVGGTTRNGPEQAWTGSGGGFSRRFAQPAYQAAAVERWLATDTTHAAAAPYFNQSGRAYPDVSAQATDFLVLVSGSTEAVSGTSAASPTFASIIQLLNSDRLAAGLRPLGFLNPWLYGSAAAGAGFTDITAGRTTGCSGVISDAGFWAVPGWDPATGLGTPLYPSLLAVAQETRWGPLR
ncbi:unnamed protein product [Diplocarpon coronariae]